MGRAVAALLCVVLVAGCGGDSSPGKEREERPDASPTVAYAEKMRPIVTAVSGTLRSAGLKRTGRDFDRGLALLEARRQMARITADPALLLAHDRLSRALGRGGTLLVADPRSPYVQAAMRAGRPRGSLGAVQAIAPELSAWAFETTEKLRSAGAPVPSWLERVKSSADRLGRRAAS